MQELGDGKGTVIVAEGLAAAAARATIRSGFAVSPNHLNIASGFQSTDTGLKAWRLAIGGLVSLLLVLQPAPARAADAGTALLTLLEGEASLVVGARAWAAAPGLRLAPGTLVETDAKAGFMRLEFADGSIVDIGPGSRVALRPTTGPGGPRTPLVYVLQGWVKQTQPAMGAGQLSALLEVPPFTGVLVSQVDSGNSIVFTESGSAQVLPRKGGNALALHIGEAAVAGSDGAAQALRRPPADWLPRIPRNFRDTLPPRAALFKGAPPQPKTRGQLSYAALQPWLTAEAGLRHDFPMRFAELLPDAAFRESVTQHMAQHPEWDSALRAFAHQAAARKTHNPNEPEAPK